MNHGQGERRDVSPPVNYQPSTTFALSQGDHRRTDVAPFALLSLCCILLWPFATHAEERVSFVKEVAPVLRSKCLACHSGASPKGDLALTTRKQLLEGGANGPAIVPGKSQESLLIKSIADKKMPPKEPLAADVVALLQRWVDEGATWDGPALEPPKKEATQRAGADWWSLQPIARPPVTTKGNVVDAFLHAKLAEKKLTLNPPTDRRTLLRRVTLDLTGLPPTPEEMDAFLADASPNAYEKVVDRLLASSAFGERWARHWLDVVRFGESSGYEVNNPRPNAWRYRDYVIRAFNRDTPFAQFIYEQLASDTLPDADELTQAATGFLVGGSHDLVGNQTEEGTRQIRSDDLFDMVSTTSTAFLGLTVGCARCHDHKFDPILQKDFYGLEAIFAGVQHEERALKGTKQAVGDVAVKRQRLAELDRLILDAEPLANLNGKATRPAVNPRRNVERFTAIEAKFVRFTIAATNNGSEPCIDELEIFGTANVALSKAGAKATASSEFPNNALHKIVHLNDGQYGNSRSWISTEPGRGWAQIELAQTTKITHVIWGRDREMKFQDRVPTKYTVAVSLDGKAWQTVADHTDRSASYVPPAALKDLLAEQATLQQTLAAVDKPATAYIGTFRQPGPTHLLKRGDVMQRGDVVVPAALGSIGPKLVLAADAPEASRRQALAKWLADPKNPLPARVFVNRLWHYHFGQGIVRTPSDFGYNGGRPSHPELLDWLASELHANGGHSKPLHKLIVMSQAYQQANTIDASKRAVDSGNTLLWRFPSRRLEAEAVRDTILQTSGALNRTMGGPGYSLWNTSNYVTIYDPKKTLTANEFRRMVYQFKPRTQQDGVFGAFDCPDATTIAPRRGSSTTALQALNLLNDEFIHDQADRLATRVQTAAGKDVVQQVQSAFRLTLQRLPTPREADAATKLVQATSLAQLCRMLFNTNEMLTLE